MGVWDTTTPAGTDGKRFGDDRIREMKVALQEALQAEGSFPGAAPGSAPKYVWTIRMGNTATRNALTPVSGQLYINTETVQFERYNGATWDAIVPMPAGGVTPAMLAAAVAGAGLKNSGTALDVGVDDSTIEISSDNLRIKDAGVTAAKLAVAVAGDGLTNDGSSLKVNTDDSTIEKNSDALRVKDLGVTEAKLALAVVAKLGQNIGIVSRVHATAGTGDSAFADVVNFTGQGRLDGIGILPHYGATSVRITVDGVAQTISMVQGVTWDSVVPNDSSSDDLFKMAGSAGNLTEINILFKTSLRVEFKINTDTGPGTDSEIRVQYERQA
jgi:hypothetical protein